MVDHFATCQQGRLFLADLDVGADHIEGALIDHSAHIDVRVGRIADAQLAHALDDLLYNLIVDRFDDDGARTSAALLALEAESAGDDAFGSSF
jgi:hypothetical protein